MDEFTDAYFEAALWSTNDESTPEGGEPLDENYTIDDIAPETLERMERDARGFLQMNWSSVAADQSPEIEEHGRWALAGHDFWLTRNRHGAGFEDGQWPNFGEELARSARSFGEFDLYVGDDGMIRGSGSSRASSPRTTDLETSTMASRKNPRRRPTARAPRGIYHDMPYIKPRDYVLHYREGKVPRWNIDRVGAGGTHTTIGPTRGYSDIEAVRKAIEDDAHTKAVSNATIHDASGEELGRLVHGRLHWFPGALAMYPAMSEQGTTRGGGRVQASARPRRPHGEFSGPHFDRIVKLFRSHGATMKDAYDMAVAERWWTYEVGGDYTWQDDGPAGEEHLTSMVTLLDADGEPVDDEPYVSSTQADIRMSAARMAVEQMRRHTGTREGRAPNWAKEAPKVRESHAVSEMIGMTYGSLPDYRDFKHDIRRKNPEDDKPYWPKGVDFPIELVDAEEIELARDYGDLIEFGTSRPGYAIGFRGDESALYSFLAYLKEEFEENENEAAGNLASSIMYALGYEWI